MRLTARISTSVRLTVEQEAALRAAAAERKQSVSRILGEIIDEWMLFRPTAQSVHGMNVSKVEKAQ